MTVFIPCLVPHVFMHEEEDEREPGFSYLHIHLIPMELNGVCILSLHFTHFVVPKFALHCPYI